jgi:hypothetical protein
MQQSPEQTPAQGATGATPEQVSQKKRGILGSLVTTISNALDEKDSASVGSPSPIVVGTQGRTLTTDIAEGVVPYEPRAQAVTVGDNNTMAPNEAIARVPENVLKPTASTEPTTSTDSTEPTASTEPVEVVDTTEVVDAVMSDNVHMKTLEGVSHVEGDQVNVFSDEGGDFVGLRFGDPDIVDQLQRQSKQGGGNVGVADPSVAHIDDILANTVSTDVGVLERGIGEASSDVSARDELAHLTNTIKASAGEEDPVHADQDGDAGFHKVNSSGLETGEFVMSGAMVSLPGVSIDLPPVDTNIDNQHAVMPESMRDTPYTNNELMEMPVAERNAVLRARLSRRAGMSWHIRAPYERVPQAKKSGVLRGHWNNFVRATVAASALMGIQAHAEAQSMYGNQVRVTGVVNGARLVVPTVALASVLVAANRADPSLQPAHVDAVVQEQVPGQIEVVSDKETRDFLTKVGIELQDMPFSIHSASGKPGSFTLGNLTKRASVKVVYFTENGVKQAKFRVDSYTLKPGSFGEQRYTDKDGQRIKKIVPIYRLETHYLFKGDNGQAFSVQPAGSQDVYGLPPLSPSR